MGVGSFYYLNGNYAFGIADHANGMKSSLPWASAGIASDGMALMQILGTSGAQALAASSSGAAAATLGKFAAAAATPIINVGLITLTAASNTLGFGRPEDGERFGSGSSQFADANDALQESVPPEDWAGSARDAYHDRNAEQQARATDMAKYDAKIKEVLAKEAGQVDNTREFVSKRQTVLALSIAPAIAAKAIPVVGAGVSAAIEIAAVVGTVPFAMQRMEEMLHHADDNASAIGEIASRYESLASAAELPGGGFGTA
jgi:uncharacterized protein YukE